MDLASLYHVLHWVQYWLVRVDLMFIEQPWMYLKRKYINKSSTELKSKQLQPNRNVLELYHLIYKYIHILKEAF